MLPWAAEIDAERISVMTPELKAGLERERAEAHSARNPDARCNVTRRFAGGDLTEALGNDTLMDQLRLIAILLSAIASALVVLGLHLWSVTL
jgi:hypothetical protein